MEFGVLGPLSVEHEGQPVEVRGKRARALLSALLLSPATTVSVDALLDVLWGDDVDGRSVSALRVQMSRLRKTLGAGATSVISTKPDGYMASVSDKEIDLLRFEELSERGRHQLHAGEFEEASTIFREALGLWRGRPFPDLADWVPAMGVLARIEEERLSTLERRVESDLALGRHGELLGELEALTAVHPFREQLWCSRMLALYRAGRQADALRSFTKVRSLMVEDLGVEPGPELRRLEAAILAHDEGLSGVPLRVRNGERASTSVMLVDDHPMWREAVRSMLERRGAATVVAEAEDGPEAVQLASQTKPAVVIMDLHLPSMDGAEAARRLLEVVPRARILMLSSSGEERDVLHAVKAGAHGYILKSATAGEIVDAVGRLAAGEPVFAPALADAILNDLRRPAGTTRIGLTPRQREVLGLVSRGRDYESIAVALTISVEAVRQEMAQALQCLQSENHGDESRRALCTVCFIDVADSTRQVAAMGDAAWRRVLRDYHALAADSAQRYGGRVLKSSGDGILMTFGQPSDAIDSALDISARVETLSLLVRAGVHIGECEFDADDIHGLAVHIGARVMSRARAGEVLVSQTVKDLVVGSGIVFESRGTHVLKGVPHRWHLFAAKGATDDQP